MGEPGAALASEIARQLNLLRQRQHVRIEPCTEQHLGLDILRGAVRFRLAENAGEAAEDLQESGNGGVIEGHAMLFRGVDGCAVRRMPQMGSAMEQYNSVGVETRQEITLPAGQTLRQAARVSHASAPAIRRSARS